MVIQAVPPSNDQSEIIVEVIEPAKGDNDAALTIAANDNDDGPLILENPEVSEMSIGAGPIGFKRQPVHESMTIVALIASDFKLDPTINYNKAVYNSKDYKDILEFRRGTV
ncbi:hypothetical protein BGX23_011294 [Mortierella sp. AD031]|nr:hypothetical protein BGX23_011294 [Mortierella sp. AD031]KAG0200437.1 hypothetical protein BGX33_010989 [Mortierella sp. NVP41]